MNDEEFSDPTWNLQLAIGRAMQAILEDSHAIISHPSNFVSTFKDITVAMSAFQLVTIFAILAIVSGFSPSRASYGRQVTVSTTQIYEVSLSMIIWWLTFAWSNFSTSFVMGRTVNNHVFERQISAS